MSELQHIASADALQAACTRAARAGRLALDIEANGLHAFRAKLCMLQLGWREDQEMVIGIIDPLAVDISPLGPLLGPDGPIKVLHDFSFDARMLGDTGITLGNLRDTAVAARFLGEPATGLSSLVEKKLEFVLSKSLQDHDWAKRPVTDKQLAYLAGDVRHLLELDDILSAEADAAGITEEIAVEIIYKLGTALAPPSTEGVPAYSRVKGYGKLDATGRAILRRLLLGRAHIAERADVPPFKICGNAQLLELAERRPTSNQQIARFFGRRRRASQQARLWASAITKGIADGAPPADDEARLKPKTMPPAERKRRKAMSAAVQGWRKAQAAIREVDLQVVLPGHCVQPTVSALIAFADGGFSALDTELAVIPGFGSCRIDRYAESLAELARAKSRPTEEVATS